MLNSIRKLAYIISVITILLIALTSCAIPVSTQIQEQSTPTQVKIPNVNKSTLAELNLVTEPQSAKKLDVPMVYSGNQLCYLGAYAMLAKYVDDKITFNDIIANSGLGGSASYIEEINIMYDGLWYACAGFAAKNQGFDHYIACLKGKGFDSYVADIKSKGEDYEYIADYFDSAKVVVEYQDESEAFTLLKRLVSSGVPVNVKVDTFYIKDPLLAYTTSWKQMFNLFKVAHLPHNLVVSGYDNKYIYLNDPRERIPGKGKDIPVEIDSFLKAWKSGNGPDWNNVFPKFVTSASTYMANVPAWSGPYFMQFLGKRKTPATLKELVKWNQEILKDGAKEIKKAAVKPEIDYTQHCSQMSQTRLVFGTYLKDNGYVEASNTLNKTGMILSNLCNSNDPAKDLLVISELQLQAANELDPGQTKVTDNSGDSISYAGSRVYHDSKYKVSVAHPNYWINASNVSPYEIYRVVNYGGLPTLSLQSWDAGFSTSLETIASGHLDWYKSHGYTNVSVVSKKETTLSDNKTPAFEIVIEFTGPQGWKGRNLYLEALKSSKWFAAIVTEQSDLYELNKQTLMDVAYSLKLE